MKTRFVLLALLLVGLAASGWCQDVEELTIRNAGLSRTVSGTVNLLKTSKIEAKGTQLLMSPSVAFMIELELDGEYIVLVPSDFDIKGLNQIKKNREIQTIIRLDSHREGIPLAIYVNYFADLKAQFQQKSIEIAANAKLPGAVLKRVVIEDMQLADRFAPVSPVNRFAGSPKPDLTDIDTRFQFDGRSNFAAIDPKSKLGLYFFVGSVSGREAFTSRGRLLMWEEMDVPLDKGYQTGRATIGVVTGSPEVIYKRFRKFVWDRYCVLRERDASTRPVSSAAQPDNIALNVHKLRAADRIELPGDELAGRQWRYLLGFVLPASVMSVKPHAMLPEARYSAFKKRFAACFAVYQHVLDFPDGKHIDGEGHIVDNRGFIVLFNPASEARKVALPLDESGLELKGKLKLSDWTQLDSSTEIGEARVGETVEIEIGPVSARVVGVNIE